MYVIMFSVKRVAFGKGAFYFILREEGTKHPLGTGAVQAGA